MISSKGGAPSLDQRKLEKQLEDTDLFNRGSDVYVFIEKELSALTPAKAFDLFCHFCAKRDFVNPYELVAKYPKRLEVIVAKRKNQLTYNILSDKLDKLCDISENVFVNYVDIHGFTSMTQNFNDSNNYKFSISSSFSWGFLSNHYSDTQREKIYRSIFDAHLNSSHELQEIYNSSSDKPSLIALHTLLILNNQRIGVEDVTENMDSPFYLQGREALLTQLKVSRYEDIEYAVSELAPQDASMPVSYKPNANIKLDIEKPITYLQEMLYVLKKDWSDNNSFLGIPEQKEKHNLIELRQKVMRFNKKQKTLAGKLTDLLYVHDCRRFGFTNPWTRDQMYSYWRKTRPKGEHGDSMSSSTHSNYLQLINTMIDQKYYKNY